MPEPASAGYRSPCPGGAHSSSGSAGQCHGRERAVVEELRHAALDEVGVQVGAERAVRGERGERVLSACGSCP